MHVEALLIQLDANLTPRLISANLKVDVDPCVAATFTSGSLVNGHLPSQLRVSTYFPDDNFAACNSWN